MFSDYFSVTLYKSCSASFSNLPCIFGLITSSIGFIFFLIILFAFIKMTRFYKKMNFENNMLLLCLIQSLIILIEIITSHNIFKCIFNFIQIFSISLIIRKFKKLSSNYLLVTEKTSTILINSVNVIYLLAFIIIMIFIKNPDSLTNCLIIMNIIYSFILLLIIILLTYYCCIFLSLIKKFKGKYNTVDDDNKQSSDKNENKDNKFITDSVKKNMMADGFFYSMKQKQYSLLYLLNIICTSLEIFIPILCYYCLKDVKEIKFTSTYYTKMPESNIAYIITYSSFFIYFIHIMINYLCFYWLIRKHYNLNGRESHLDMIENGERLLDENFINKQCENYLAEDLDVNKYLADQKSNTKVQRSTTEISDLDNQWTVIKKKEDNDDLETKATRQLSLDSSFGD